jgi:hypothetical protein
MSTYFDKTYYSAVKNCLNFKDFSDIYFKHSIVPSSWTSTISLLTSPQQTNILEALVDFLDEIGNDSLIIIDSLTDLAISGAIKIIDLVSVIKGIQRESKKWNGLVYIILTNDILSKTRQQMFIDSVDGVLMFEWGRSPRSSQRLRYMYIEKFTALWPFLKKEKIARFVTEVSEQSGFIILDRETIK